MLEFELVVPAYNEGKGIKDLIERTVEIAKSKNFNSETFKLVIVNNGSSDNTLEILDSISASNLGSWIRIIKIKNNQGYGHGIWKGLSATKAPYIAWSHADLQCDPADAFKALEIVKDNNEDPLLVKGARSGRDWKDSFVSRIFEIVARLILRKKLLEINAQPKVFHRKLLNHCNNPPKDFSFDVYVLYVALKNGFRIKNIPVLFPPRIHGTSNWSYNFLIKHKTIIALIAYMFKLAKSR